MSFSPGSCPRQQAPPSGGHRGVSRLGPRRGIVHWGWSRRLEVDVAKLDRTLMRIREIALKELCTHSEADVQLQASFMLKNSRLEPIYEDT